MEGSACGVNSLGFDKKLVDKALDKIVTGEETVEQLIKQALKIL